MPATQRNIIFNYYFEFRKNQKINSSKEDPNTFTFKPQINFGSVSGSNIVPSKNTSSSKVNVNAKKNKGNYNNKEHDQSEGNTITLNAITLDNTDDHYQN